MLNLIVDTDKSWWIISKNWVKMNVIQNITNSWKDVDPNNGFIKQYLQII